MVIRLVAVVAGAYLTNQPNLPGNLIMNINKSHAHNKNFRQSAASLSLSSKFSCLLITSRLWKLATDF